MNLLNYFTIFTAKNLYFFFQELQPKLICCNSCSKHYHFLIFTFDCFREKAWFSSLNTISNCIFVCIFFFTSLILPQSTFFFLKQDEIFFVKSFVKFKIECAYEFIYPPFVDEISFDSYSNIMFEYRHIW